MFENLNLASTLKPSAGKAYTVSVFINGFLFLAASSLPALVMLRCMYKNLHIYSEIGTSLLMS